MPELIVPASGPTAESFWREGSAILYQSGLAVDADGAPQAYHPLDHPGLDALANAGRPGDWFGIVTADGTPAGAPIVQGPHDPAPGFYVSDTSLQDAAFAASDPRRYVDAVSRPYAVVPPCLMHHQLAGGLHLGDVVAVFHVGRTAYALVADEGPDGRAGEGSVKLADLLAINPSPRHGGVTGGVLWCLFPGSGESLLAHGLAAAWEQLEGAGESLFAAWGGPDRLAKVLGVESNS